MVGGLLFGIFAIFLFLGVPIAICLGLASTVTLMVLGDVPLAAIVQRMYSATDSFPMMAIPYFMRDPRAVRVCVKCSLLLAPLPAWAWTPLAP